MPAQPKDTLVVVLDSSRARFLKLEGGELISAFAPIKNNAVKMHTCELKSDKPGRAFGSSRSPVRHAIEPHHDYHKLEKHKFAVHVAQVMEEAITSGEFKELVIVAPRRTLGELRILLSKTTLALVKHEIAKDLIDHTTADLRRELASVFVARL